MVTYEELYEIVKESLSEKRFNHTLGVVERALEYAEIYGANIEDTKKAAILHDIAKEIPHQEAYKMFENFGVELDEIEKKNDNLIHSKLGAVIAKYKYNLSDDICNAISFHTTGRANMSLLEKIIYLADATEKGRVYKSELNMMTLDELVNLIKKDIDDGLIYVLSYTLKSLIYRNLYIHINSVNAYNFYKKVEII